MPCSETTTFRLVLNISTLFLSKSEDFWKNFPEKVCSRSGIWRERNLVKQMSPALKAALNQPDYRKTFARAVLHADTTIRRYIWRGYRPRGTGSNEIMVGDKTAKDFVSEAIIRL